MPRRILLADDDPLTLKNISTFLLQHGYEIREAINGAQALRLLQTERFALVISDIVMPWMNGCEIVEVVRGPRYSWITGHPSLTPTTVKSTY